MKGNIYIITSKQTDKVYVGSTVKTLKKRFRDHKSGKDCSSVEILKYGDAEIKLIECYECEDEEQLKNREGEYQREYNCVNKKIEGRKKKQYYEDNKDKISEYKQKYREENKDKILEYHQKYREENKERINKNFDCECGGRYAHCNKSKHIKTKKHQDYLTKEI